MNMLVSFTENYEHFQVWKWVCIVKTHRTSSWRSASGGWWESVKGVAPPWAGEYVRKKNGGSPSFLVILSGFWGRVRWIEIMKLVGASWSLSYSFSFFFSFSYSYIERKREEKGKVSRFLIENEARGFLIKKIRDSRSSSTTGRSALTLSVTRERKATYRKS